MIASAVLAVEPPLDPDADEARDWVVRELADPAYAAAQPTWFDLASQAILDWIGSIRLPGGDGGSGFGALLVVLIVAAIVVIALVVYGVPRRGRRSRAAGALFGDDDERDAATLRRSADDAARRGDWTTAIVERFRAIARGLAERTIVSVTPGTTARGFAERAGVAFSAHAEELRAAAGVFDDVRYLGAPGTSEQAQRLAALDAALQQARPALERATASGVGAGPA